MGASPYPVRHPLSWGVPRMTNPWIAALSALFLWWFSTGIILWRVKRADNDGRDAHLWSVILGLPLLMAGVGGIMATLNDASAYGAYVAFLSALAIWAWIELAFLSGIITGPNRAPCPAQSGQWDRFMRACGTIAWHELLLLATVVALARLSLGAENIFGLWTFVILFFARISAKLNLFFGVPRIHTEFLPRPLAHLPSHFRHAPMNWVFPVSITALSFASACWLERVWTATTDGQLVGFTLLAALTLLALLEHWFMVLPLPDEKLWRWMMPAPRPVTATTPAPATRHDQ
jgi:putative photosynthetic complex assembly protein 2